jgi:hypothetical protein
MFDVTLNMHRAGRYQPGETVCVSSALAALDALDALPGDVLWVRPVGEDFKFDYRVENGADGLILRTI